MGSSAVVYETRVNCGGSYLLCTLGRANPRWSRYPSGTPASDLAMRMPGAVQLSPITIRPSECGKSGSDRLATGSRWTNTSSYKTSGSPRRQSRSAKGAEPACGLISCGLISSITNAIFYTRH